MKLKNTLWGLLFIAGAGIVTLSILGLLGEVSWISLLISVPIIACIIYCAAKLQWFGVFFPAALLVLIYKAGIEGALDIKVNIWAVVGIAALLAVGFHIIFGKNEKHWKPQRLADCAPENCTGEKLYFKEQFTGTSKYINSENLSYVQILNRFGGMEVYFDHAKLASDGAVIEIENRFGGLELYIPRAWNIVNQMTNNFAGVDCPNVTFMEGAPTITLMGNTSFGGVDIKFI